MSLVLDHPGAWGPASKSVIRALSQESEKVEGLMTSPSYSQIHRPRRRHCTPTSPHYHLSLHTIPFCVSHINSTTKFNAFRSIHSGHTQSNPSSSTEYRKVSGLFAHSCLSLEKFLITVTDLPTALCVTIYLHTYPHAHTLDIRDIFLQFQQFRHFYRDLHCHRTRYPKPEPQGR